MRAVTLAFTLGVLSVGPALAQVESDIATLRSQIQADRQAIVAENLELGDAEGQIFWPLYRDYRNDMSKVGDRIVKLLQDYANSQGTLTDAQASTMLDEYLAVQKDELKVRSSWAGKMRKTLPAKTVTRFFQIEGKLDAIQRAYAALELPLVRR